MTRRPRIVLCTGIYPPSIGGPATYAKLLRDELPKQGIDVDVATFDDVRHLPKVVRHAAFFFMVLRRSWGVDAIMAQDTVSVGTPAALAALLLRKPLIVRVPGDYAWEQGSQRFGVTDDIDTFQSRRYGLAVEALRRIQRFVVRSARVAIAPSEYFAGIVRGWTKRPERVKRIYNGVERPVMPSRDQARRGLGIDPDAFVVTTIGRLVPWKGFEGAVDAFKLAFPSAEGAERLFVIGDGPQRATLVSKATSDPRVTLTGSVDRDAVFRYLAASDVFLLNTSFESFSFQIVEALMAGIPVLSTSICNIPEIVEDGVTGTLVRPDDVPALAKALAAYRADPALGRAQGERGLARADLFSIERTVTELSAVIKNL
jgi:glycosyltransferase involved in cell wall biosynthesis